MKAIGIRTGDDDEDNDKYPQRQCRKAYNPGEITEPQGRRISANLIQPPWPTSLSYSRAYRASSLPRERPVKITWSRGICRPGGAYGYSEDEDEADGKQRFVAMDYRCHVEGPSR